jgi:hypothetical protein
VGGAHSIRAHFAEHLPADDRAEFERLVERARGLGAEIG